MKKKDGSLHVNLVEYQHQDTYTSTTMITKDDSLHVKLVEL